MSTIASPSTPTAPVTTPTSSNPVSNQQALTPERINTLLKAGPNWSSSPKAPDRSPHTPLSPTTKSNTSPSMSEVEAKNKLDDLNTALTPDTIKEIQRNPSSPKSRAITEQFNTTLTPENVKLMSRGANAKKNRETLREIRDKLDKKNIDSNLESAKHQVINEAADKMRLKLLEIITAAFDGDIWNTVDHHKNWLEELGGLSKNFSAMETKSKALTDAASSLSDEKLDQSAAPETQDSSPADTRAATYSFNATSESTLEAPSEVRNFKSGDKLDLSGIQRQLNTSLRPVDRFPEVIGEMQIHHSPSANTSVIVIADAPGKDPFLLKVFGEVRQSNIVT